MQEKSLRKTKFSHVICVFCPGKRDVIRTRVVVVYPHRWLQAPLRTGVGFDGEHRGIAAEGGVV